VVSIDVIDAGGRLAQPHLSGIRIADADLFAWQHLRTAGPTNANRVRASYSPIALGQLLDFEGHGTPSQGVTLVHYMQRNFAENAI
jgi:hypothetical protein